MVWSHKTGAEIEIHVNHASAMAVANANRYRGVQQPVKVVHHAPKQMNGRREIIEPVQFEDAKLAHWSRPPAQIRTRLDIPYAIQKKLKYLIKGSHQGLRLFTQFDLNYIIKSAASIHPDATVESVSKALGQRNDRVSKAIGALSWLDEYGMVLPQGNIKLYESKNDELIIEDVYNMQR